MPYAIRLEIFEPISMIFFQNFSYVQTYVYANECTHTTARERGNDYRKNKKSAEQICLKTIFAAGGTRRLEWI